MRRAGLILLILGIGAAGVLVHRNETLRPGPLRSLVRQIYQATDRATDTQASQTVHFRFSGSHGLLVLIPTYNDMPPAARERLPTAVRETIEKKNIGARGSVFYVNEDQVVDYRLLPTAVAAQFGLERGDEVTFAVVHDSAAPERVLLRLVPSNQLNAIA